MNYGIFCCGAHLNIPILSIVRREAAEGGSPTGGPQGPQGPQGHSVVVAIDFGTTYRQVQCIAVQCIATADIHFYI